MLEKTVRLSPVQQRGAHVVVGHGDETWIIQLLSYMQHLLTNHTRLWQVAMHVAVAHHAPQRLNSSGKASILRASFRARL